MICFGFPLGQTYPLFSSQQDKPWAEKFLLGQTCIYRQLLLAGKTMVPDGTNQCYRQAKPSAPDGTNYRRKKVPVRTNLYQQTPDFTGISASGIL